MGETTFKPEPNPLAPIFDEALLTLNLAIGLVLAGASLVVGGIVFHIRRRGRH